MDFQTVRPTGAVYSDSMPLGVASIEPTEHLQQQVAIVHELLELHQKNISKPEQDWIQNAISYTQQVINAISAYRTTQNAENNFHRRLHSFQALTSRYRQPQPPSAMWSSQLLIATQNLNGAMNLLSSYARADSQTGNAATALHTTQPVPDMSKVEMSHFLNRRNIGKNSDRDQATFHRQPTNEGLSTDLQARNTLFHNTAPDTFSMNNGRRSRDGKLPLPLVETVEIWRQNAEDALEGTMVQHLDGIAQHAYTVNGWTTTDGAVSVRSDLVEMPLHSPSLTASSFQPHSSSTRNVSTSDTSSQLDRLSSASSSVPRRKPLSVPSQPFHPNMSVVSAPSTVTDLTLQTSHSSTMSSSYSSYASPPMKSTSFNAHPTLPTTFDQKPTLTPSTAISPNSYAPEISPFQALHGKASLSAVSLLSTPHGDHRPSPDSLQIDSVVSLPSPLPHRKHDFVADLPAWQQLESARSAGPHRKSRGRVWLERAMMSDDD